MPTLNPKSIRSQLALAFAAGACAALLAFPAAAGPARESRSVAVNYADLDLRDEQDVATLYARLDRAARATCGVADARNLAQMADWRRCRSEALDGAVSEVANERLSALHAKAAPARRLLAMQ
jgi:UrcA family protein